MSEEQAKGEQSERGGVTIQALHRGLMVLEALAGERGDASLAQLASQFHWHKSTTLRLLKTLVHHGHVEQDPETQRYRLGLGILRLSSALGRRLDLRERAAGLIRALAERTRETAHVAVLDRGEAVVLEQAETSERIRIITYVGMRMPCHCTALGKALLAHLSEAEFDHLVADVGLERFTERTITCPQALQSHLAEVREQGYAFDYEEYDPGMSCLASTIRDRNGRVVAAVGISGPSTRMRSQEFDKVVEIVKETGSQISQRLGYMPKP